MYSINTPTKFYSITTINYIFVINLATFEGKNDDEIRGTTTNAFLYNHFVEYFFNYVIDIPTCQQSSTNNACIPTPVQFQIEAVEVHF